MKKSKRKVGKFIYWTPRILSIAMLCFLALFSLDVFDMKLNFWGTVLGLLVHNIPVFVLLAALIVSWKREIVGGIIFNLAGLTYIYLALVRGNVPWYIALSWSTIIAGPLFLIGILFIVNWVQKKKR
jgi:hypothetical protein